MFVNLKNNILYFLFPLRPLKIFRSVLIIAILAALIGLSFLLNTVSIKIPSTGISISFSWIPTIIIGWFFGPIIGFFMGFLIDTLNWLIFGGMWFWLYAIQEPCVGLFVGIISSIYNIYFYNNKKIKLAIIINQIIMLIFLITTLFIIYYYTSPNSKAYQQLIISGQLPKKTNTIFRYLISSFLIVFFIIVEIIIFINYFRQKNNYEKILKFIFISSISICLTFIFSFILGPISSIKYYEFLNNKTPPNLLKFGVIYYILPRVIKECIKTPIYIGLLSAIIYSITPIINKVKQNVINKY